MTGLPSDFSRCLRYTFNRCGPFDSDRTLRAIFVDARIHPWRDAIADNTPSRAARIDALIEGGIHFHRHEMAPVGTCLSEGRCDFYRYIDLPPHYIERAEALSAIRDTLLSSTDSVALTSAVKVALHGMGGIGKTVLARALCDDEAVRDRFKDGILWATLGQTPDIIRWLRDWIRELGGIISANAPTLPQLKARLSDLLQDRDLLHTLEREKLVLDWCKRQQPRASVKMTIEDALYEGLPVRYTGELCDQKRDDLYQHVYERYVDAEHSIYAAG